MFKAIRIVDGQHEVRGDDWPDPWDLTEMLDLREFFDHLLQVFIAAGDFARDEANDFAREEIELLEQRLDD